MPRSHTHVGEYTTENENIICNWVPEKQELVDDIYRHTNLGKYGNRHFWCRCYYVDMVGRNRKAIEKYIRNQLQEDIMGDQMSFIEYLAVYG